MERKINRHYLETPNAAGGLDRAEGLCRVLLLRLELTVLHLGCLQRGSLWGERGSTKGFKNQMELSHGGRQRFQDQVQGSMSSTGRFQPGGDGSDRRLQRQRLAGFFLVGAKEKMEK